MIIDKINNTHIIADTNMVFQRISDGIIFGNEIYLGYTYYLNGIKLDIPLKELPEHFREIEDVSKNENVPNSGS
jgi:hypothetical protein